MADMGSAPGATGPRAVGRVERLWVKRMRRGPMDAVSKVEVEARVGLAGNANRGGRRQITLLSKEVWERLMAELGGDLDPSTRRANVLVSGLDLVESRGRVIKLGDVRVEIAGETKPCERMEEAMPGLRQAMRPNWNGGAYGMVLDGGTIRVGDDASWDAVRTAAESTSDG